MEGEDLWDEFDQWGSQMSNKFNQDVKYTVRDEERDIKLAGQQRKMHIKELLTIFAIALFEHFPDGNIKPEW